MHECFDISVEFTSLTPLHVSILDAIPFTTMLSFYPCFDAYIKLSNISISQNIGTINNIG